MFTSAIFRAKIVMFGNTITEKDELIIWMEFWTHQLKITQKTSPLNNNFYCSMQVYRISSIKYQVSSIVCICILLTSWLFLQVTIVYHYHSANASSLIRATCSKMPQAISEKKKRAQNIMALKFKNVLKNMYLNNYLHFIHLFNLEFTNWNPESFKFIVYLKICVSKFIFLIAWWQICYLTEMDNYCLLLSSNKIMH